MNYEQKYNEVLQKAKEEYNRLGELGNESMKRRFEIIFPELRESEDERIRKEAISIVQSYMNICDKEGDPCLSGHKVIAWLEKQKEQKPVKKEITLTNFEEVLNTFLFDFANSPIEDCEPKEYTKKHSAEILKAAYTELNAQLKQDIFEAQQEGRREGYEAAKAEQKPEWSEEDEEHRKWILECLNSNASRMPEYADEFQAAWLWLKSLRPQPKQEWSEEDEEMVQFYLDETEHKHGDWPNCEVVEMREKFKQWLKSLRPQPKQV